MDFLYSLYTHPGSDHVTAISNKINISPALFQGYLSKCRSVKHLSKVFVRLVEIVLPGPFLVFLNVARRFIRDVW